MVKEIIIPLNGRVDIHSMTIGVFPVKGRYYRKIMKMNNGGFFVELNLSLGTSFYHLFLNDDFTTEYLDINTSLNGQNLKSTVPIIIGSEVFTHLCFRNDPKFISFIQPNLVEIKVISYFSWINEVKLVSEEFLEFEFHICFEYKNVKYWNLRYKKGNQRRFALKFGTTNRQYWLLKNNSVSKEFTPLAFFKFFDISKQRNNLSTFTTGYQIFPDSFCKSIFQTKNANFMAWESKPTIYNYFGGDIKGIIERLDYIEKLGIDFIYLNPIFYSRSTHRYDTIDYRKIDPILGTLDDFNVLVKKIHAKKLKIILDISLNHSSVDLFAFKDLLTYQEKSRYLDWYLIGEFPVSKDKANYSCWHGYSELPQFNLNNEAVQNYLIESALFWMKEFNIDGWRIDVSNELPDQFMRRFVKETKDFNQSILLIGENMHGESESFVNDAGADGITAYDLYQNIFKQYFLNDRINLIELAHNLLEYNYSHSFWAINYSWNFLSNHDIPRFFSVLEKKENYFLAFSLLLAIPGTPVLYYGEELLIDGDPENNRCSMNWDEYNIATPSFLFLQKLISIRKGYKQVFENGNIEIPFVDNYREILVVSRKFEHWNICFVLNFSEGSRTMHFEDFISTYKSYKVLLGNFSDKKEIEILNKATNIYLFEC